MQYKRRRRRLPMKLPIISSMYFRIIRFDLVNRRLEWILLLFLALPSSTRADEPGPITLTVDASEIHQQRIEARLVIPAKPGPLTLLYPKWLPGTHGPGGPIAPPGALNLPTGPKPLPLHRHPL